MISSTHKSSDWYRGIAVELRTLADQAREQGWFECQRVLEERADLNDHMAENLERAEANNV